MEKTELEKILGRYGKNPSQIIAILHELQDAERYLPEPDLRYIADQLRISVSQIYHIATFYKAYSLKPKGKHLCNVCLGTACHVRGAPLVLEEMERKLGIKSGDTTEDREFSLSTVNCLGACALGPLVTIDGEYFGNMNYAKVGKMLEQVKAKGNGGAKPAEETVRADPSVRPPEEKKAKSAEKKEEAKVVRADPSVCPEPGVCPEPAKEKPDRKRGAKKAIPAKAKAGTKGGKKK